MLKRSKVAQTCAERSKKLRDKKKDMIFLSHAHTDKIFAYVSDQLDLQNSNPET